MPEWFEAEDEDPDILARIAGEIIAAASLTLPDAAQFVDEAVRAVDVDLPDGSRARLYFRRRQHKRGRTVRWWWAAFRAELIE